MSLRRIAASVAIVALASTLPAVVGQAPTALAQGPRPVVIPVRGATDVVADPVTQRIFVSTAKENLVKVFTWDGEVVGEVPVGHPLGMDYDPLTSRVFVASSGAGSGIVAINTVTLAATGYTSGGGECPSGVAVMGDVVWFAYRGVGCSGFGGVGYLDLAAPTPEGKLTDLKYLSDPLVGGAAGVLSILGQDTDTWLVAGGEHALAARSWDAGSNGRDIAATPDGTEVVFSDGNNQSYDPLTLTPTPTTYPMPAYSKSADFGADGSLLAAGSNRLVRVFPRGSDVPVAEWDLWDAVLGGDLLPGGLAMGGTSRVFALAESSTSVDHFLIIYSLGSQVPSALALDPLRFGEIGHEVTVSGLLLAPAVADQLVEIRRIDPVGSPSGGASVPLGTATVDADGTFSFADTPTDVGFTRYVARWAGVKGGTGDGAVDPAEAAVAIDVRRHPTPLTLDLDSQRYEADALITATVTHGDSDPEPGIITVFREYPGGFRYEVDSGTVAAGVPLVVQVPAFSSGYLVAEYAGSSTGDEASVVSDPYTVIPMLRGVVKSAYEQRGDTWFVAPRDTPRVRWHLKPNPFTQCSSLTLQHETRRGWQRLRHSDCVYLLTKPTTPLKRDHAEGDRWRVRVTVSETPTHEARTSDWAYITFRKPLQ